MEELVYCIDTSSLIKIGREFPRDVFPSVWKNIDHLARNERLISPTEVFKELEIGFDAVFRWAKNRKTMFIKLDTQQATVVSKIIESFTDLVDHSRQTPDADPFLIALAKTKNETREDLFDQRKYIVITEESPLRGVRIPHVCKHYDIECINLMGLFRKENWKF